ncbi:hypothetical protein C8T65DRAFT_830832 [Cerioporus squamosus]|nr:hypothetical protein C8T65DRAFT_830832 [Cerioporus squamosus]
MHARGTRLILAAVFAAVACASEYVGANSNPSQRSPVRVQARRVFANRTASCSHVASIRLDAIGLDASRWSASSSDADRTLTVQDIRPGCAMDGIAIPLAPSAT